MALNISGRMKVKTLQAQFKEEFGLTLRVYDGRSFADEDATLASIRKGDTKGGEFSPRKNTKVGNLEDRIMDMFGIKTQIAGSDDSYLCDNDKTLAGALEADKKLMLKRENRIDKITINDNEEEMEVLVDDYMFVVADASMDVECVKFIRVAIFIKVIEQDMVRIFHAYVIGYTGSGMQEGRYYTWEEDDVIVNMSPDGQTWDRIYDISSDEDIDEDVIVGPAELEIYHDLTNQSKKILTEIDDMQFTVKESIYKDMEEDEGLLFLSSELSCDFEDIEPLLSTIGDTDVWPFITRY